MTLTERQQEVLDFIVEFRGEHGFSPTLREICKRFDFASPAGAKCHIEALSRKGAIKYLPGAPRTITPVTCEASNVD